MTASLQQPASEDAGYDTPQERLWAGEFGTEYSQRNQPAAMLGHRMALWSRMLARVEQVPASIVEFGPNLGVNLQALATLFPDVELHAVEINPFAAQRLEQWGRATIHCGSFLEYKPSAQVDLSFTSGVLIHVAPDHLPDAYEVLYRSSRRHVLVVEYYNPTPVSIPYRGEQEMLFKRDFAGEMLERYRDLRLVDYGFAYRRDPVIKADDATWFLMEKVGNR